MSPAGRAGARPAAGALLIASDQIRGSIFGESVVLLLDYGPTGAVGLIVNRPMVSVGLGKLWPEIEALQERADPVYLGGPVEGHSVMLLFRSEEPIPHASRVLDDVFVSASPETFQYLLDSQVPSGRMHAYVGYAGWGPGQLDSEIARGDWHVTPADSAHIFREDPDRLWRELIQRYRGLMVRRADDNGAPHSAGGA